MINCGHNGWLSVNLLQGSASNITNQFAVTFNATAKVMSFNDAADYTAQLIASKYNNLHLCLSGGLDSEFVAKVLTRNNIKFTPVILEADFCEAETWYAYRACEEFKLSPIVINYTGQEQHMQLVKEIIKCSLRLNVPCDQGLLLNVIASLIPAVTFINGYGDPIPVTNHYTETIGNAVEITDHDYFIDLEFGSQHPGGFYSYTPELFTAMVTSIDTSKNIQMAKSILYDLIPRSKIHENIFNFYPSVHLDSIMERVLKTHGKLNTSNSVTINRDILLNQLTGL
jgi:hypothetical protein